MSKRKPNETEVSIVATFQDNEIYRDNVYVNVDNKRNCSKLRKEVMKEILSEISLYIINPNTMDEIE